jgi:N-acetyl-gamma-glutamylphosphate reductase
MVQIVRPSDPVLVRLLSAHLGVTLVDGSFDGLSILQGDWKRELVVGDPSCEVAGLVELMDNNPLVCCDRASVPGAVATLALVALGPLARAGLILEEPVMQVGGADDDGTVPGFLAREGWGGGVAVSVGDEDLKGAVAANVVAMVPTPGDWGEIDELYRECYAHSFYVRESSEGVWDAGMVIGRPHACYRLSRTAGEGTSLLTVQAMADRDGKCGAAQMVHAMNVMCGFEESLGL